MHGKLSNPLHSFWHTLLLWLVAAFKSTELVRALFRGTEAWFDQGITTILFFATCVLSNRHDLAANRAARRVRFGLLALLGLSLAWSTLRTTQGVVVNRMEHDRLVAIQAQMMQSETRRLRPVYKKYEHDNESLRCDTAAPVDRVRCAVLSRRISDIAHFRLAQPEQSNSADVLGAALRARQEEFRRNLLEARVISKRLPRPVDFEVGRKQYGYWEMMQWMRDNPTRIEVQAVVGSLMNHGLVLTIAMLLASILDLLKRPRSTASPAPAPVQPTPAK